MIERVNPASYNLTAHLAAHATTLRDAIESMQRFYQLLTDRPSWQRFAEDASTDLLLLRPRARVAAGPALPQRDDHHRVSPDDHDDRAARPPADGGLRLPGAGLPRRVQPHLRRGRAPSGWTSTGSPGHRVRPDLARRQPTATRSDQAAAIVTQAERRVSRLRNDAGYAERVRRHILEGATPARHDMQSISRALGVSARSLRRRLDEEGVSFRDVVDGALGVLAKRLVADKDRPIEDVAYAMGFSHPNAFHRAFKRWTGATPAASRPSRSRGDARSEPPRGARGRRRSPRSGRLAHRPSHSRRSRLPFRYREAVGHCDSAASCLPAASTACASALI